MLSFFRNSKNRETLTNAYNALVRARENSIGFTVEDPNTSENPVETMAQIQSFQAQYLDVQGRIGKKRLSVSSIVRKGDSRVVARLISDMDRYRKSYEKKTLNRSAYGILAPLAFGGREKLIAVMGNPESPNTFSLTWAVHFQELSSEDPNFGLLEQMGVDMDQVSRWFFEDKTERAEEATDVWDDVKRLALRLVYLFDQIVKTRLGEVSTQIHGLRTSLTKLGTTIARLIFLRPNRIDDTRQFLEFLVPAVYRLTLLLSSQQELRSITGKNCIKFLDIYISGLESSRTKLISELGVTEAMEQYSQTDNQTWLPSVNAERIEMANLAASTKERLIASLRSSGLAEIPLVVTFDDHLGDGSFSDVYECSTRDGSATYAVKFAKLRSGLRKTEERVLREVERWNGLCHENVNVLLGFTTHPESTFPGLVSKVYASSLYKYISKENVHISDMDKLVILSQTAEALRYLHEQKNLAHGDVRPANILVDSRMTAKLSDFGNAYIEDSAAETTTLQKTNDAFLAPELKQRKDGLRQVSIQGDIFAFGCCFLNVFYIARMTIDTVERLRKIGASNGKIPKIPELTRDIQPEHWAFLLKTWDDKPERRPTAREVIGMIHDFMS